MSQQDANAIEILTHIDELNQQITDMSSWPKTALTDIQIGQKRAEIRSLKNSIAMSQVQATLEYQNEKLEQNDARWQEIAPSIKHLDGIISSRKFWGKVTLAFILGAAGTAGTLLTSIIWGGKKDK